MNNLMHYINGSWVSPSDNTPRPVFNPSTEEAYTNIVWGTDSEVNLAVSSAKTAFESWAFSTKQQRIDLLNAIIDVYGRRKDEMGETISLEMGAPIDMALRDQSGAGIGHLKAFVRALESMEFERAFSAERPDNRIVLEPIGVCALITPWNWPMNQVALKVGAAIAAGCTMVLKPSEIAPMSSVLFTEFMDEAGVPAGVFNMLNGDGMGVGKALSCHPDVDMVSFTGSTRAGTAISKASADTIKRVSLELGGKSPNLIFADCDVKKAVEFGASFCFANTGQSCNAASRMLVERSVYDQAVEIATATAKATVVDMANKNGNHIGPLVSADHFDKVQGLIQQGIDEGARLTAGGVGRPEGLNRGWFVKPTVFADVSDEMTIWREEIFGPVLAMTPFDTEEQAIKMANDTPYGLSSYLQSGDNERIKRIAPQLRSGMVQINCTYRASGAPFGGYKQSGNGREGGVWGIEEFLETKSISGWPV